jgi:hypothetical protein
VVITGQKLGFNDTAHFDEGSMWPTAFALTELTTAAETRIAALMKKAVSWGLLREKEPLP